MLLPKGTIYLGTQRNTIELSRVQKAYEEYIILTDTLSRAILRAWERNQNKPRCGLPRKIWKRLLVSGNCTGASLIRRRYGWLYRLSLGKSRPLCPSPKQGTIFHPLVETPDSSPHLFWLACRVERDGRGCDTPTIRLGLIGHFTKSICKIWVRIRVETQGLTTVALVEGEEETSPPRSLKKPPAVTSDGLARSLRPAPTAPSSGPA